MLLELETTTLTKPEVLTEALKLLKDKISKLKQHSFTTTIPLDVIGLFVGKQGTYTYFTFIYPSISSYLKPLPKDIFSNF